MSQLGYGAKELVKDFDRELDSIFALTADPVIRNHIINLRTILHDDMKPKLQRATAAEPTAEQRQRATEERVKALEARMAAIEPILSLVEQRNAQRY
jgi:hypothetical protein